jgi:hypothetical protein
VYSPIKKDEFNQISKPLSLEAKCNKVVQAVSNSAQFDTVAVDIELGAAVGTSVGAVVGRCVSPWSVGSAVGVVVGAREGAAVMQLVENEPSTIHNSEEYFQVPPASLRSEAVMSFE